MPALSVFCRYGTAASLPQYSSHGGAQHQSRAGCNGAMAHVPCQSLVAMLNTCDPVALDCILGSLLLRQTGNADHRSFSRIEAFYIIARTFLIFRFSVRSCEVLVEAHVTATFDGGLHAIE